MVKCRRPADQNHFFGSPTRSRITICPDVQTMTMKIIVTCFLLISTRDVVQSFSVNNRVLLANRKSAAYHPKLFLLNDGRQAHEHKKETEANEETLLSTSIFPVRQQSSSSSSEKEDFAIESESLLFGMEWYNLVAPAVIGIVTGLAVATFKETVEMVRRLVYGEIFVFPDFPELLLFIPAIGGILVGILGLLGGPFPPGLRDAVIVVDRQSESKKLNISSVVSEQINGARKAIASIFTLGTGNSLGPEGPSVELGMNMARFVLHTFPMNPQNSTTFPSDPKSRNRLLMSCGAAAGVSAGFNAPLAGVFFALEVMNAAFRNSDQKLLMAKSNATSLSGSSTGITSSFLSSTGCISAVLLSSVLSALVSRTLLGNSLVFKLSIYSLNTPLIEMPVYLVLGALSGVVAFLFSQTANASQNFFNGKLGPEILRENMRNVPKFFKPALGGLICGLISLTFPQILFFGYETLNSLLASSAFTNNMVPVLQLLVVKLIATGICAGSGLVGGTFAPSLFLGAMLGAAFHGALVPLFTSLDSTSLSTIVSSSLDSGIGSILRDNLSDVQAYTIVGAGSVLAALFRAPLTASLLLFELTRDYDVILPLMASAGIGSFVGDILEGRWKESRITDTPKVMSSADNTIPSLATAVAVGTSAVPSIPTTTPILTNRNHREDDTVSWGDLSTSDDAIELIEEQSEMEEETKVVVDTKMTQ